MVRSYTADKLKQMANTLAKKVEVAKVFEGKRPNTDEPWVGIEIEFYTDFEHIGRIIANSDIAEYIEIGEDGSIEINYDDELNYGWDDNSWFCWEMRICAPEHKIREVVGKACSILRYIKAKTNSSCGLHIHLDHRMSVGRSPVITFNNLIKLQGVLFGVNDKSREDNQYCQPVNESSNFYDHIFHQMSESEYDEDSRYYAINLMALRDTNTIEIRIFNGTTKYREISHFLNLVLGAAKSKVMVEKITEKNVDIVTTIPYGTRNFVKKKIRKAA
jgi:hypothetical protein